MKVTINTAIKKGRFKDPTAWQNSTLRYTPPADFPSFLAHTLGRAKIMRTFITLDEYWDYRTGNIYPDYAIGVKRYPDSALHYIYDWKMIVPAPSGIRFRDYLCSHAQNADELMLNVRRLEREVSDGIITYDQYENIFRCAVEYCKELAPNIRYIECCNEIDLVAFGNLTADEYLKIYLCALRAVRSLNEKHNYPVKLEIGGWSVAKPFVNRPLWEEFLTKLASSYTNGKPIDFYSYHYYDQACGEGLVRRNMDSEAQSLGAIGRFRLLIKRHNDLIAKLGLPKGAIFMDELGKTRTTGVIGDALRNAAGTLTYLLASEDSDFDNFFMFPWCTFHNPELQISYTQFVLNSDGRYAATPNGIALLMLHEMSGERIFCKVSDCNGADSDYRAAAVIDGDTVYVVCVNPTQESENCTVNIALPCGNYNVEECLCDSKHNNIVTSHGDGTLTVTAELRKISDGTISFNIVLEANAFVMFRINKE